VRIDDDVTLRIGKYGPYLEVAGDTTGPDATPRRINIPQDLAPDELTPTKAHELIDAPVVTDRVIGVNPANGKRIVAKDGRFGPYVTELDPDEPAESATAEAATADGSIVDGSIVDGSIVDGSIVDPATGEVLETATAAAAAEPATTAKKPAARKAPKKVAAAKPRTASLFKSMDLASIDLDTALQLLDLPRIVGIDPESGEEIQAQNGRYGPYLKKGTDTRSLTSEDQIFDIDLAGAIELYALPKYGARRASSAIKEFEADPVSGKPIRVKDGRFGPYVTDGETNATIPKNEMIEEIDFERAVQLLADKRAKGPAAPRKTAARKPAAKKTTAAKTTAAKTTTKPAVKKPATRKAAPKK
jgi:DNA topoisomerase-1